MSAQTVSRIAGAAGLLVRWFPVLAAAFCVAMLFLLEGKYEEQYAAQYNQAQAEMAMGWNDVSVDMGGNPLASFGIHVANSKLWPTFLLGDLVDRDIRIPVEAAIQCVAMLLISAILVRMSGALLSEAFAISVVAQCYCWIPFFSAGAITELAVSGLVAQDGAIAVLFTIFFFLNIGLRDNSKKIWPSLGLALTVVWFFLTLPFSTPIFALAMAFMCIGAICAVECRKEFRTKAVISASIVGVLLLLGFHKYILNILAYTPQTFYRTLEATYFAPLSFRNETLLVAAIYSWNTSVLLFFGLAAVGTMAALQHGNRFARRIVFAGIALEVLTHAFSALNIAFKVVPMTFLYIELMGIPVLAILAGTGAWVIMRAAGAGIEKALVSAK